MNTNWVVEGEKMLQKLGLIKILYWATLQSLQLQQASE